MLNPDGGRVGIGDTAYGNVSCTISQLVSSDIILQVERVNGDTAFQVQSDGDLSGCGISCFSDARLKERIEPLRGSLRSVLDLRGVTFHWKPELDRDPGRQYGFIAQEVAQVLPDLVEEASDGMLTVDYVSLTAVLAEAIEEQQQQIEQLRAETDALRSQRDALVSSLTERLAKVEARYAAPASALPR
jgi:hypothetical protein